MTAARGPRVHVIGISPGARELPPEARSAALGAALLAGVPRHLALAPEFGGERWSLEGEGRLAALAGRLAADPELQAAVLASGDPGFFGFAATVLRRLPPGEVRVWPAVSSMQLAFARAGEPWSGARFASLHGRPLEELAPVLGARRVGVFTDSRNTPARIARFLEEAGWGGREMVVAEDLGLPTERVTRGPCEGFLAWSGSDLNVVVLLGPGDDPRPLGPGLPDEGFAHSRGLLTKAEVRAVALGLLRLPRAGVFWDVGAGSGSVAVEACLLAPGLRAYAVEKSAEGIAHVRENRRRFRTAGLVPVHGEAPGALSGLPDPDAVFLGGSGGRLGELLDAAFGRLRSGGTLVTAAVLLDTLGETVGWARARGLEPDVTQVSCARSRPVAGRLRLEPLNPVSLLRFVRAAERGT
ncbi:MAG: precorrin-6y C5,15-methyltransferase (decarboxylating) subunit CbiE [Thermodesulfobacteriota bacterium]